jgi:hypothetical protein
VIKYLDSFSDTRGGRRTKPGSRQSTTKSSLVRKAIRPSDLLALVAGCLGDNVLIESESAAVKKRRLLQVVWRILPARPQQQCAMRLCWLN